MNHFCHQNITFRKNYFENDFFKLPSSSLKCFRLRILAQNFNMMIIEQSRMVYLYACFVWQFMTTFSNKKTKKSIETKFKTWMSVWAKNI